MTSSFPELQCNDRTTNRITGCNIHIEPTIKATKRKLKWGWIRMNTKPTESLIYSTKKYSLHDTYDEFINVKTFDDLHSNLYNVALSINSLTGAYFDLDKKTGIIYRDKHNMVVWI